LALAAQSRSAGVFAGGACRHRHGASAGSGLDALYAAVREVPARLVPLEVLHLALVLLRRTFAGEGCEVAPLAGAWTFLARIEPVLAGLEFADHGPISRAHLAVTSSGKAGPLFRRLPAEGEGAAVVIIIVPVVGAHIAPAARRRTQSPRRGGN